MMMSTLDSAQEGRVLRWDGLDLISRSSGSLRSPGLAVNDSILLCT